MCVFVLLNLWVHCALCVCVSMPMCDYVVGQGNSDLASARTV